jgi:hypothetical protein
MPPTRQEPSAVEGTPTTARYVRTPPLSATHPIGPPSLRGAEASHQRREVRSNITPPTFPEQGPGSSVPVRVTVTGTVCRPLTLTALLESEMLVKVGITAAAREGAGAATTGSGRATTAAVAAVSHPVARLIRFP